MFGCFGPSMQKLVSATVVELLTLDWLAGKSIDNRPGAQQEPKRNSWSQHIWWDLR